MSPETRLHLPFRTADATDLGLTARQVHSERFRTVLRGVMVQADVPDTVVVRSRAALLLAPPDAVLSHWTAARLWGGTTPQTPWVHLTTTGGHRMRVDGIRHHRHHHRLELTRRHGLPVTSPLQTLGHLSRGSGLFDLVALGDSLVKKHRFALPDLTSYAAAWPGQCRREFMTAAGLVRAGVDSAPETTLRLLMVLAGLPEPTVNIEIRDADGEVRFRIDLGYEEARLAIEYDGRWHDDDAAQQARDRDRRASLHEGEGWDFVIVKAKELFEETEMLLARLRAEIATHGIPLTSPPTDWWRQHFRCPVHVAA